MKPMPRTATAADAAALAAADAACRNRPWSVRQFAAALGHARNRIFIIETDNRPAAFAVWQILADEAELHLLCTLPEYRRQGLAARLLDDFCRTAAQQGIKRLLLEVGTANLAAQTLYRRCGFTENGRRKNYYPLPQGGSEDAVLMEKIC